MREIERGGGRKGEGERERGGLADEILKKSNRMERTPPGLKWSKEVGGTGEKREMKNEEGTMIGMLKDLKEEMTGLRYEVKEIKENWELRMERMKRKMANMEKKMKEIERWRKETGDMKGENIEEIVEKIAERVRKNKGKKEMREREEETKDEIGQEVRRLKRIIEEKEKKDRRKRIIIRRLNTSTMTRSIKDAAKELREQEFEIKENVKSV